MKFELKKTLGLIGSTLLFAGVFTPVFKVSFLGNVSLFELETVGVIAGIIILALAVISLFLVLNNRYKWLWLSGIGSAVPMIFIYFSVILELQKDSSGLGRLLFDFQWGWALLIIGAVLIIASAAMKDET